MAPMLGVFAFAQAAPLTSLGDAMAMHVTGEAGIRSESNVLMRSSNEKSDVAYQFTPGVELDLGTAGISDVNGVISYRYHITDYSDLSDLNSRNNDLRSVISLKNADYKVTGSLSYIEMQTNQDVNIAEDNGVSSLQPGLVSRSVLDVSGYVEMSVSPKTKIGTGVGYNDQNYVNGSGYTDFSNYSMPFDVYMALTPKIDFTAGYLYRPVIVGQSDAVAATDHRVSLGLRGELMPKLTGYANIGFMKRNSRNEGMKGDSGMSLDARLNYAVSPLVNLGAKAMRDYSISPVSANTTTRTGLIINGDYKMSRMFGAGVTMGYIKTEYLDASNRTDDYLVAGLSMTYRPSEYLNVRASYTYNNNDSTAAALEYGNNILEVVASFRY